MYPPKKLLRNGIIFVALALLASSTSVAQVAGTSVSEGYLLRMCPTGKPEYAEFERFLLDLLGGPGAQVPVGVTVSPPSTDITVDVGNYRVTALGSAKLSSDGSILYAGATFSVAGEIVCGLELSGSVWDDIPTRVCVTCHGLNPSAPLYLRLCNNGCRGA
ncbi:MAG: hypothetical protein KDD44_08685, partial [Bdellovibrionales bacterium]|nr:hypothetical protein [Bdellovibrionales bacterium]